MFNIIDAIKRHGFVKKSRRVLSLLATLTEQLIKTVFEREEKMWSVCFFCVPSFIKKKGPRIPQRAQSRLSRVKCSSAPGQGMKRRAQHAEDEKKSLDCPPQSHSLLQSAV